MKDVEREKIREKIREAIEGQLRVADGVGRMSNYNIAQMILVELEMYHNAEILYNKKATKYWEQVKNELENL